MIFKITLNFIFTSIIWYNMLFDLKKKKNRKMIFHITESNMKSYDFSKTWWLMVHVSQCAIPDEISMHKLFTHHKNWPVRFSNVKKSIGKGKTPLHPFVNQIVLIRPSIFPIYLLSPFRNRDSNSRVCLPTRASYFNHNSRNKKKNKY